LFGIEAVSIGGIGLTGGNSMNGMWKPALMMLVIHGVVVILDQAIGKECNRSPTICDLLVDGVEEKDDECCFESFGNLGKRYHEMMG
jgi:hypothetical protein